MGGLITNNNCKYVILILHASIFLWYYKYLYSKKRERQREQMGNWRAWKNGCSQKSKIGLNKFCRFKLTQIKNMLYLLLLSCESRVNKISTPIWLFIEKKMPKKCEQIWNKNIAEKIPAMTLSRNYAILTDLMHPYVILTNDLKK